VSSNDSAFAALHYSFSLMEESREGIEFKYYDVVAVTSQGTMPVKLAVLPAILNICFLSNARTLIQYRKCDNLLCRLQLLSMSRSAGALTCTSLFPRSKSHKHEAVARMQEDAAQFMAQAFIAIGSVEAAAVSAQHEEGETPSPAQC
jgi:hypothetical protein